MSKSDKAVIDTAKAHQECDNDEIHVLSTGVRVRIKPVSPSLIAEATARVEDPKVPTVLIEAKGRHEENPDHPEYIAAMLKADNERGIAAMDAMAMFGFELVDPIPDDGWDKKLLYLGVKFDPKNEIEREFYYKKHIAVSIEDYELLKSVSGLTDGGVQRARRSFRGN